MARKFKSPGKAYKRFGQKSAEDDAVLAETSGRSPLQQRTPVSRSWLASRMEMLNIALFTFFAILGYVQYFVRQAPAGNSLAMGIGFTLILGLYLILLRARHKKPLFGTKRKK